MTHADSLAEPNAWLVNRDRALSEEAMTLMEAYARLCRDPDYAGMCKPDRATLAAAEETIVWFNDCLTDLAPGPVDSNDGFLLAVRRDFALSVLINYGGPAWAKRRQLELTSQRALALCTGGRGGGDADRFLLQTE